MNKCVLHKNEDNTVAITVLAPNSKRTLHSIARQVTITGSGYALVDVQDIPDIRFQSAWEIDDSELTDGVGTDEHLGEL